MNISIIYNKDSILKILDTSYLRIYNYKHN